MGTGRHHVLHLLGDMVQPSDSPNLPGWEAKDDYESGLGDQAFASCMKSLQGPLEPGDLVQLSLSGEGPVGPPTHAREAGPDKGAWSTGAG